MDPNNLSDEEKMDWIVLFVDLEIFMNIFLLGLLIALFFV